jgi:hypothetical protein
MESVDFSGGKEPPRACDRVSSVYPEEPEGRQNKSFSEEVP